MHVWVTRAALVRNVEWLGACGLGEGSRCVLGVAELMEQERLVDGVRAREVAREREACALREIWRRAW